MQNIIIDYATLKTQYAERGLRLYYVTLYADNGSTIIGYTLYGASGTFIFSALVQGADIADFDATLKPYAVQAASEAIVFALTATTPAVFIRQERKTVGHYTPLPLILANIGPGLTQYLDYAIPDLSDGLDVLSVSLYSANAEEGDEAVTAKLLAGTIAQVAVPAVTTATTVTIAGPREVLQSSKFGGYLDEGLFLSFGVDTVTAAQINAASGTGVNPTPELTEYQVKRVSAATEIGGGNVMVTVTLFSPLLADVGVGLPVNLVHRWLWSSLPIDPQAPMVLGGESFTAGNVPAGKIVRFGYKNAGLAAKTARAYLAVLY